MKIYISADMEGVAGVSHWDDTYKNKPEHNELREHMTGEVAAACEGAAEAGATEIWVQDAHDSGRNIIASKLPRGVKIVNGWSGHPFNMAQDLDSSFDALCFVGYHSPSGSGESPLAHTMTTNFTHFAINGATASEFLIHALAAATVGVPVAFASGDEGLCDHVKALNPSITTVGVKKGTGSAISSMHPQDAAELIRSKMNEALTGDLGRGLMKLHGSWEIEIGFKEPSRAYKASWYPGASLKNAQTILFTAQDYFEVLRMMLFVG